MPLDSRCQSWPRRIRSGPSPVSPRPGGRDPVERGSLLSLRRERTARSPLAARIATWRRLNRAPILAAKDTERSLQRARGRGTEPGRCRLIVQKSNAHPPEPGPVPPNGTAAAKEQKVPSPNIGQQPDRASWERSRLCRPLPGPLRCTVVAPVASPYPRSLRWTHGSGAALAVHTARESGRRDRGPPRGGPDGAAPRRIRRAARHSHHLRGLPSRLLQPLGGDSRAAEDRRPRHPPVRAHRRASVPLRFRILPCPRTASVVR